MTSAQRFLEKYADTPIEEIDASKANEILRRSGFLTRTNKVSKRYACVVVRNDQTSANHSVKTGDGVDTHGIIKN